MMLPRHILQSVVQWKEMLRGIYRFVVELVPDLLLDFRELLLWENPFGKQLFAGFVVSLCVVNVSFVSTWI